MSAQLAYGLHAVGRCLRQDPDRCRELVCAERRNPRLLELIALAEAARVPQRFAEADALTRLAGSDKHQGCVLLLATVGPTLDFDSCVASIRPDSLLLVLDGVQDPHNLGACLRSADACGVDAVIIPRDRSARLNATVRKVAAGAAESVPLLEVTNLARSLRALKDAGVWIYGAAGDAADSLYAQDFAGPAALVMGGEGKGLRRLTREACDHVVRLPMRGRVESLNVSVATGICLYEIRRARGDFGA